MGVLGSVVEVSDGVTDEKKVGPPCSNVHEVNNEKDGSVLKIEVIFRSVGNVIQQIKRCLLTSPKNGVIDEPNLFLNNYSSLCIF